MTTWEIAFYIAIAAFTAYVWGDIYTRNRR